MGGLFQESTLPLAEPCCLARELPGFQSSCCGALSIPGLLGCSRAAFHERRTLGAALFGEGAAKRERWEEDVILCDTIV